MPACGAWAVGEGLSTLEYDVGGDGFVLID